MNLVSFSYAIYKTHFASCMQLTPEQSIQIFGYWDQPREFLSWEDVKSKSLSWRDLRVNYGCTAKQLHRMQPDKHEWLRRGNLAIGDAWDLVIFPVNPFEDLRADLAEVWHMRWPVDALVSMGVTYEQLRQNGMSEDIMRQFGFPLSGWQKLSLRSEHVTPNMAANFGLSAGEVQRILQEHQPVHKVTHLGANR